MGLAACEKQHQYQSEGIITNYDVTMTPCSGGIFIEIDNETYRFYAENLPTGHQLDFTNFPINVDLDWNPPTNDCTKIIEIIAIEEQ